MKFKYSVMLLLFAVTITGCSKKDSLVAIPPPVANFGYTINRINGGYLPYTVNFIDSSKNTPGSYKWEFKDGGISSDKNPVHIFTDNGSFRVKLTVNNTGGTDSISKTVYIAGTKISTVKYTKVIFGQPIVIKKTGGILMPELSKTDSVKFSFFNSIGTNIHTNATDSIVLVSITSPVINFSSVTGYRQTIYGRMLTTGNPLQYANGDSLLASSVFDAKIYDNTLLAVYKDVNCVACAFSGNHEPRGLIPGDAVFDAYFKENDEGYLLFSYPNSDRSYSYGWILININHTRVIVKGYAFQGTTPLKAGQ